MTTFCSVGYAPSISCWLRTQYFEMSWPIYISMVVADVLVPIGTRPPTDIKCGLDCDCSGTMDILHNMLIAMTTSSNGNIFRVTVPLCGEFTGHRWIPLTKACDAELWCFLWSAPEQAVEWTIEMPMIWDAIAFMITSLQWRCSHSVQESPGGRLPVVSLLLLSDESNANCSTRRGGPACFVSTQI